MKKTLSIIAALFSVMAAMAQSYIPTDDNLAAREEFRNAKLGIFLHWGIWKSHAHLTPEGKVVLTP